MGRVWLHWLVRLGALLTALKSDCLDALSKLAVTPAPRSSTPAPAAIQAPVICHGRSAAGGAGAGAALGALAVGAAAAGTPRGSDAAGAGRETAGGAATMGVEPWDATNFTTTRSF